MKRTILFFIAALAVNLAAQDHFGPNIILFMVDDMGYGDAGVYGQTMFTTPNLDLMAAEGMRFTDFYSAATVCAPSRGSIMQGLHTGHGRIKGNNATYLKDSDVTFAEVLKFGGYHTGCVGKWGVGEFAPADNPAVQGMDYFYGYVGNYHAHNFYPEFIYKNGEKIPLDNVCTRNCGVDGERTEGRGVSENIHNDYVPLLLSDEAEAFIKRNYAAEKPFFLYYTPNIPHTNNEGGYDGHGQEVPDYGEFATESWPKVEQGFAQMMRYIDNDVGMMMHLLDSLGIAENTLMIFTSDNGPHQEGGHSMPFFDSNGDLRGKKRDLWDGGVRGPMIARWPGMIEPESVTDHIGFSPDFMPTFAELAGVTVPDPTDGISILPILLGRPDDQQQHEYLYWEHSGNTAIRYENWKLVGNALYNLTDDLGEQNDLAGSNSSIVNTLKGFVTEANVDPPVDVTWDQQRFLPAIIRGCMDSAYVEHDTAANVPDSSVCQTLAVGKHREAVMNRLVSFVPGNRLLTVHAPVSFTVKLSGMDGKTVWQRAGKGRQTYRMDRTIDPGMYILRLEISDMILTKQFAVVSR